MKWERSHEREHEREHEKEHEKEQEREQESKHEREQEGEKESKHERQQEGVQERVAVTDVKKRGRTQAGTGSYKEMGIVYKQEKVQNRIPENLQTFIRLNCHFDFLVPHNNLTSYIKTKIEGTVNVI